MTFIDDEIVAERKKFSQEVKKKIEEYQKARKNLTPEEIKKVAPLFLVHYKKQMAIEDVNQRTWYRDDLGRDYILFETDEKALTKKNKDGELTTWNSWKSDTWKDGTTFKKLQAKFPLKSKNTGESFSARVSVTWTDPSEKEYAQVKKWNIMIVASGIMKLQAKGSKESNAEICTIDEYIRKMELTDFFELNFTETIIYYNFTMFQLLGVREL